MDSVDEFVNGSKDYECSKSKLANYDVIAMNDGVDRKSIVDVPNTAERVHIQSISSVSTAILTPSSRQSNTKQ